MRFLLLVTGWATVAFIPAWIVAHPYQQVIGAIAARIVSPPGSTIEFVDLEIFFPFDIAIYAALTLASTWATWPRRMRTLALGLPVMVVLEVVTLALAMGAMLSAASAGTEALQEAQRFSTGIIRVTGLVTAAGVWFYFVGRERLSLAARTWLGA